MRNIPLTDSELLNRAEGLRPEVFAFAELMEEQLRENDKKKGWKGSKWLWLLNKASQKVNLLFDLVSKRKRVAETAADAANYLMMVVDVTVGLGGSEDGK